MKMKEKSLDSKGCFKPGYLFGNYRKEFLRLINMSKQEKKEYLDSRAAYVKEFLRDMSEKESKYGYAWDVTETPLKYYCSPKGYLGAGIEPLYDFENLLMALDSRRRDSGSKEFLNVLDVGTGTGSGWFPFMDEHTINYRGTNLGLHQSIHPRLKEFIVACNASELHLHFPPNHFDIIVSHYGTKFMVPELIENAVYVAKPGGYILLTDRLSKEFTEYMNPYRQSNQYYTVEGYFPPSYFSDWFLMLKKTN